MKVMSLAGDKFSPVTFRCAFLEAPFERVVEVYLDWIKEIPAFSKFEVLKIESSLDGILCKLDPLDDQGRRRAIIETKSNWTAYFKNSLGTGMGELVFTTLIPRLNCRGVYITSSPHTLSADQRSGMYGQLQFQLWGTEKTEWFTWNRTVAVGYESANKLQFVADGTPLPFEETEKYETRKKSDRFTADMLDRYCRAMGIRAFDEDFYGPKGVVVAVEGPVVRRVISMTDWKKQNMADSNLKRNTRE